MKKKLEQLEELDNEQRPNWHKTKQPWNKNKAVGQKKPFTPRQIDALKDILTNRKDIKELALFSFGVECGFSSKKLLQTKVKEVKEWYLAGRISKETWRNIYDLIIIELKNDDDYLFTAEGRGNPLTRQAYAKKIKKWCVYLGLNPELYSGQSVVYSGRNINNPNVPLFGNYP